VLLRRQQWYSYLPCQSYLWGRALSTEARRILMFRCAKTGERFAVVFVKQPSDSRYRVVNVFKERETTAKSGTGDTAKALPQPRQFAENAIVQVRSILSRLLPTQRKPTHIEPTEQKREQFKGAHTHQTAPNNDFDAKDFDFAGWYCPCCGHGKAPTSSTLFFQCGRCGEYVCGSRVEILPNGQRMVSCHDGCGNRSVLGGGTLSSLSGVGAKRSTPDALDGGRRKQLKAPPKQLPPGKK